MLLAGKTLILFSIVIAVNGQIGSPICEPDTSFQTLFSGSYYSRAARNRCKFQNVKSLEELSKQKLTVGAESVATIVFVNSSLSTFPDKFFSNYGLRNVRKLDASRLVLEEIATSAFFDAKNWDFIDFSNNQIKKIGGRTFATMLIKMLDLSMNYIESIEDNAFLSAEVEKLILSNNKLKSISFVNSFNTFNLLELNSNLFEELDKIKVKKDSWTSRRGLFGDPEYPKIFLRNNQLKKIECDSTVRLSALNLEENTKLSEVSLNQCELDALDVSNCASLSKVSLNDNLQGLTAKNTKLGDIHFAGAKSLTTLSLENSSITNELFDKVMKMENLTYLDLSHNSLGALNISTFSKLKNLQFLFLKATNISNIQFGTFSHQHAVKQLDISDNSLGFFDMNMIFSMNSLLVLDLSGNSLESLENVDNAHFMFTLLNKIDLSGNKWPCSYLMRLVKIFRVYKVALARSNLEETNTNHHGIRCVHIEGQEDFIEPLTSADTNITDIRNKMNEIIQESGKNAQFRATVDSRLKQLETRIDNQVASAVSSAALRSEKSENIEVKNSTLLEGVLIIVCICFTVFMSIKTFVYVKRNFLGRPKQMRALSENTLTMNVDYD